MRLARACWYDILCQLSIHGLNKSDESKELNDVLASPNLGN